MRVLQRYILVDFLVNLAGALAVFTGILFLGSLYRPIREGYSPWQIARFMYLYLPYVLTWSLPLSVLVASLTSFARLAESGELTAVQSSGIHIGQLLVPVLAAAILLSGFSFYANASLIPACRQRRNEVMREMVFDLLWSRIVRSGEKEVRLGPYKFFVGETNGNVLRSVVIRIPVGDGESLLISASEASLHRETDGLPGIPKLLLTDGSTTLFREGVEEPPREWTWSKNVLTVSTHEATELKERDLDFRDLDLGAADHLVEFHKRIALSTVNLIFGLLGAGLGMLSRKASRILGFAAALLLSFGVYYPLLVLGIWMAKEGLVPPWLGLWIPNLLFAAGGCALCRTVIRP